MKIAIAAIVLTSACAGARWTARDTVAEVGFAGTMALDYMQTRSITAQCIESNPIIGACGQRVRPEIYFPLAMLLHIGASVLLPHGWARTTFQGVSLGAEGAVVFWNWRDGVRP